MGRGSLKDWWPPLSHQVQALAALPHLVFFAFALEYSNTRSQKATYKEGFAVSQRPSPVPSSLSGRLGSSHSPLQPLYLPIVSGLHWGWQMLSGHIVTLVGLVPSQSLWWPLMCHLPLTLSLGSLALCIWSPLSYSGLGLGVCSSGACKISDVLVSR